MKSLYMAKLIDQPYLYPVLGIDYHKTAICNIKSRYSTTGKIVTPRAIDKIEFALCPLNTKNSRKNSIAILLLYWEIIAHGIA